jgi:hypothetical protein
MPTGPKGERRPRDPNQLGKLIVDISVGEVEDRVPTPEDDATRLSPLRKVRQQGMAPRRRDDRATRRSAPARHAKL